VGSVEKAEMDSSLPSSISAILGGRTTLSRSYYRSGIKGSAE